MKNPQDDVPPGLKSLRTLSLEPSAFLATRVEKNFETHILTRSQQHSTWSAMKNAALVAIVLAVGFWQFRSGFHSDKQSFALGKPYLIKMDIREIPESEVAYAEISLKGENIQFSSEKFKNIQKDKTIILSAESFSQKQYLPVVVEGIHSGLAQVTVSFYNEERKLMSTKTTDLNFEGTEI